MPTEDTISVLEKLDERFDLLAADATEYAIVLVGSDGHVLCWNPGAERSFGYPSQEIVGKHFSLLFSPDDIRAGRPEQELRTALAGDQALSDLWQLRKDGTRFWCRATITPLLNESQQIRSFARVTHDLTDSCAQDAQRKRADDLARANQSQEEFMALLAHELRSPLSPILNALNIQRQIKTDDPLLQQAGDIIERQVGQMVRLVDDLLDVGRITKGKLRLSKEPVELRVVVNRAAEDVRTLIDARKHDFSMSLPLRPIWVNADPARLEQIVVNLLNNAAKYTHPGGLIRINVYQDGTEAVVKVSDNGPGISSEMLPRVFDLFTQGNGTLGHSQGGLGIGLALVRNLVEMHDGSVQAHSAGLKQGCEFTVRLPAISDTLGPETKIAVERIQHTTRGLRIMVVEDNVDSADSLSMLLRLHGNEVLVARTGPTALDVASDIKPHVVLLDIGLPGMDGYQVARCLREQPEFENTVLCALTGFTPSDADRRRHQETGFDYHFVKPVNLERLLEVFKSVEQCK